MTNKLTKKKNTAFDKLSQKNKRIVIAQDVIAHLNTKKMIAKSGSYVTLYEGDREFDNSQITSNKTSLKDVFMSNPNTTCKVCAKGALFMTYVGKVNKFQTKSLISKGNSDCLIQPKQKTFKKLAEIFDPKQLTLIEEAFEGDGISISANQSMLSEAEMKAAHEYYKKIETKFFKIKNVSGWSTPEYRLRMIMKNIIKNEGTFKP